MSTVIGKKIFLKRLENNRRRSFSDRVPGLDADDSEWICTLTGGGRGEGRIFSPQPSPGRLYPGILLTHFCPASGKRVKQSLRQQPVQAADTTWLLALCQSQRAHSLTVACVLGS